MFLNNGCKMCGRCCEYVSVSIPPPNFNCKKTIDKYRWMLAHANIKLRKHKDGEWFVIFEDKCKYYDKDSHKCVAYEDRFDVCRLLNATSCSENIKYEGWTIFETLEQFDELY